MELKPLPSQSKSASAAPPLVPTPPAEVFVRTMESDLRSLRESGGARPKAERIVLSPNAREERPPRFTWFASKNIEMRWLFIAGAAAAALAGVLAYAFFNFSLPTLTGLSPAVSSEITAEAPEKKTETAAASATLDIAAPARRGVIFRKAPDQTIAFSAGGTVRSIDDLKTPVQRLKENLGSLRIAASSSLVQVQPADSEGAALSLSQMLSLLDLAIFDPAFLSLHFEEQFAMFVYKNSKGWWPGYVLALLPGENWLFLKDEAAALEKSSKLPNFYLDFPGAPQRGFRDVQIGNVAARALEWQGGAKFIYGWFRGYLILSASQEGLEAVLPRL